MDLIKTLLVYMMIVIGSATEAAPAVTPPPQGLPVPTPYVTLAPTAIPTAVPTPPPTPSPMPYTTLYVGDRGEDVRKLQRRLAELGYLTDKIDGIYGQNTKRAVERFQYYNNLKVDGVAGRSTLTLLYESPSVVPGPPDVTAAPTPTATPLVGVNVPVYYVDQNGRLLNRVNMTCYGNTVIYANSNYVDTSYTLTSPASVTVSVRNGVASPASVTFRYQQNVVTATPAAATVVIPVYYMTDNGALLYQTTATAARGVTTYIQVNTSLVPINYELTGSSTAAVTVTSQGTPVPASVVFTFKNAMPTATPGPRQAQVPVRYVNENGFLINETTVTLGYGATTPVYASAGIVQEGYTLISANPVNVTVSNTGAVTPAVVIFTYRFLPPTAVPTQVPTAVPTQPPTPVPTQPPTPVPTQPPTPVPTQPPTPVPTQPPTAVPTAIPIQPATPVPTQPPTPVPTEVPTPVPTEVPTPVPTEVPTPEPTEAPKPDPLTKAGDTAQINENTVSLDWYRDENGSVMVSLQKLAGLAGWAYNPQGESTVLGHKLQTAYTDNTLFGLIVDDLSQAENGLAWNGDLYVNFNFLRALGVDVSLPGNQLVITFPTE